MAYKFFDKRYLVMPDAENIVGKRVFYNDSLHDLIAEVESGDFVRNTDVLDSIVDGGCCFEIGGGAAWGLAYYDPNYACKAAYSQGRQIQIGVDGTDEWADDETPVWDEHAVYRVKPDKWFVHEAAGGGFCMDNSSDTYVEFEGTEEECAKWIDGHTPKTRRFTKRELAEWGARNKGQILYLGHAHTTYYYLDGSDDETVDDCIKIRAWSETGWHEPLVEVKE